jgi:hypothetical protein
VRKPSPNPIAPHQRALILGTLSAHVRQALALGTGDVPDPVQAPKLEVECPTPLAAIGAKQQRALVQNAAIPRGAPFYADGLNMTVVMVDLDAPSGGH